MEIMVLVKKKLIRIQIDLSMMPALKCINNLAILGCVIPGQVST